MGSIKRGILLLALGHQNYYKMAVNLAASLKYNNPDIPIAIINDGSCAIDSSIFDHSILINPLGPLHGIKTEIYQHSPFDKTLFLDVDMISIVGSDIKKLFDELDGVPFTVMNKQQEHCVWADPKKVREATANTEDPMYVYFSELMYFEKGKDTKALFTEAKKQMKSDVSNRSFAGGVADELAFILAAMKLRVQPHKANWLPVFWHFRSKQEATLQPYKLKDRYYLYSIGGNVTPNYVKANYNNLVAFYSQKMGISRPYTATDKRSFLPSRAKI